MIEPLETRIAPAGAPVVNLSDFANPQGFTIRGVAAGDYAGSSVRAAGDVNGDGFADLIIGARRADPNGNSSGAAYVVFGRAPGFAATFDLSSLDGANGFKLSGGAAGDSSGVSVSGAGDVNGDGFADLLVSADLAPSGAGNGASYVVFGRAAGFAADLRLSTLNGANGFKISGEKTGDRSGFSVSGAGDVNGDGFADVLVGNYVDGGGTDPGAAYVVFGKGGGFGANFNLATLNGNNGFKIVGEPGGSAGFSVSDAGDVNGDGFADVLIGAPNASPNGARSGAAFVIFGKGSRFAPTLTLAALDGTAGFKLSGEAANDLAGGAVSGIGDVNGDGFADFALRAEGADVPVNNSGATYVIFGKKAGFPANLNLAALNGANGFKVIGVQGGAVTGRSVGGAGDLNGDGFADLLCGASGLDLNGIESGGGFVIFGKASGFAATFDLATLTGASGFRLLGAAAGDQSGFAVSGGGDFNGDGLADLVVGAPNASGTGAAYVVFGQVGGFGATLQLSALQGFSGHTGFRLTGAAAGDYSGYSVSDAGDVNGDGFGDVIIGAKFAATSGPSGGPEGGAAYVVFGRAAGFPADFNLAALDGKIGFRIEGGAAGDRTGRSVSSAGDLNGDGFDDVLVGANYAVSSTGAAYVIFGRRSGFAPDLNVSALNGTNGFRLVGATVGDFFGLYGGSAGDVNGDGFDDLVIGANGNDVNGSNSGAAYVIFGKATSFGTTFSVSALNGTNGFKLNGEAAGDLAGRSVSGAGDVNGDGLADVLVGASAADPNGTSSGAAYVVFGRRSGFAAALNLSALNGANGFKLSGAAAGDQAGRAVSGAGDINGDGFADLVVASEYADTSGSNSGDCSVIFGRGAPFAANLNLSAVDGTNGFRISGDKADDFLGRSVSGAGDVNGDGFPDLLLGASGADPNGSRSGASFVVFGRAAGFGASLNVAALNGANGFKVSGEAATDYAGRSVSAAGDVNGDGIADLIIGADSIVPATPVGVGKSYVVFGSKAAKVVTANVGRFMVLDPNGDIPITAGAGSSITINDANDTPVKIVITGDARVRLTLALDGDVGTIEVLRSTPTSTLTITVPRGSGGTTIGHIVFADDETGSPRHVGSVKLGPKVLLGDGTTAGGPALRITGKAKTLLLADVNRNAVVALGDRLPYDVPGSTAPDTLNHRPNLTIRDVLGPGVEVNVLGDGQPAGRGGGGLGKVVVQSWGRDAAGELAAYPGFIRTTQSIGSFRLLEGDFVGGIEIDKEHVGDLTSAGIVLVSIRGDFAGILTAEGAVGTFSAADFPGSIVAGAIKTLNLKGAFSGRVTLSSQTLGTGDLRDPVALFEKLAAPRNQVSSFLAGQLSPTAQGMLRALTDASRASAELAENARSVLLGELNQLLNGTSLFEADRFRGIALSEATEALLESDARGAELIRLNRLLLGDAYRDPAALHLALLAEAPPLAAAQTFRATDFNDPAALAAALFAQADPVAAAVWDDLSAARQRVLANPAATATQLNTVLLSAFNSLLNGPSLADDPDFDAVNLSPDTAELVALPAANPDDVRRLNRLLLTDAFRQDTLPFLGAFQEAPRTASIALKKVSVTGEFTGTLTSDSEIKNFALTNAFRGSVAAAAIGKITAFSFDGGSAKSIEATSGALGVIKASSGVIANYHIDTGDQPFAGFAVTRSKLRVDTVGLENVSVVAAQIGKITVALRADASTSSVVLTGIKNSTFESTVGSIGAITSSHTIEDSRFAAKTDIGGLKINGGDLVRTQLLAGTNLATGSIGAITITGDVSSAVIGAGYDISSGRLGTVASKIASLVVTGQATGSIFAAGEFKTAPRINGESVNPAMDEQFRTLPSLLGPATG